MSYLPYDGSVEAEPGDKSANDKVNLVESWSALILSLAHLDLWLVESMKSFPILSHNPRSLNSIGASDCQQVVIVKIVLTLVIHLEIAADQSILFEKDS